MPPRPTNGPNPPPGEDQQLAFAWTNERPTSAYVTHGPPPTKDGTSDEHASYGPGHPWHYLKRGDNADPLPVSAIQPAPPHEHVFDRELPKFGPKRLIKARDLLQAEQKGLAEDSARYQDIVERGADALSRYDREMAHGGDLDMARASALALKHNHIAGRLGRIAILERELSRSVARLR